MSAWINAGLHAGHKQLCNHAIAATVVVRRWPEPLLLHPLATARSPGRQ